MFERIKNFLRPAIADTTTAPMGEVAVTDTALYTKMGFRPYNPDTLVTRKGLEIYDEMRLDDQVKFCLALKKRGVLAPGWCIEAASDSPEDEEVAEFVRYALNQMAGTVETMLFEVLSALDFGYSITEIVWRIYEDGPHAGKVGIDRLKGKRPHAYQFDIDEFGNLKPNGVMQQTLGVNELRLPTSKFVVYSYQKEFSNHYGTSDLRGAYRSWWSKDNIIKFWNIYLERFGSPLAVGKYKTLDPNAKTTLLNILSNLQSKTSIVHKEGDFDIALLEAQRRSTSDYETSLNFHDRATARAILIPDKVFTSNETGAYAQSKTHFDVFLWVLDHLRNELCETVMQEQIIWRLIDYNFKGLTDAPRFRFNPLTVEQKVALAGAFADAVQKGAVRPTFDDENAVRKSLGFKEVDESTYEKQKEDEVAKAAKDAAVAQPAPAEKKKEFAVPRSLTSYERRVDFTAVEKDLDALESRAAKNIREVLTKQRDALTAFVASKQVNEKLTAALINTGIDLRYTNELRAAVRGMFEETFDLGYSDGKKELPARFAAKARPGIAVKPIKAIDYFGAKTDFVVRGMRDPLISGTQRVLLNALKTGETAGETTKKLQGIYNPYLADGEVLIDGEQVKGHRLETIIRTNMSEAYAWGRRAMGDDTDGYVIGYQFSEILDDRTTDISKYVDGLVIAADSPYIADLTYPLHYNDRGMFVFVTKDDSRPDFISESTALRIIAMQGDFA